MDLQQICSATKTITAEVAQFIKDQLGQVSNDEIVDKAHNSLVSFVDKTAEQMLVKGLSEIVPEATFITEEETIENEESPLQWVIDPLDGTTNFLHGIPIFCVSVALVRDGQPVVGVVYEVVRGECFSAWLGGGAYLDDQSISVKQNDQLSDALLATGFPGRKFHLLSPYLVTLEAFVRSTRGLRRLGAAAVDLAYVACGRFDGYFEYGLSPWDIAAGILIVKEAGGEISNFKGGELDMSSGEMVASNALIHQALIEKIALGLGAS